jgi:hypothetical protein
MNKTDKENATLQTAQATSAQENRKPVTLKRKVTLRRKVTLKRKRKPVTLKRKVTLRRKVTIRRKVTLRRKHAPVTIKRKVTLRRKRTPVTIKRKVTLRRKVTATVTTYQNALDATGVTILGWLDQFYPTRDEAQHEWHNLLGYLAETYDLTDEDGEPIDFFTAYVTDATAEQAQQLRTNYETIYIAYSAELDKYVLLTTWWGCSMEQVPVTEYTRNSTQVA